MPDGSTFPEDSLDIDLYDGINPLDDLLESKGCTTNNTIQSDECIANEMSTPSPSNPTSTSMKNSHRIPKLTYCNSISSISSEKTCEINEVSTLTHMHRAPPQIQANNTKRKLCHFWDRGICKNGNNCRFLHTTRNTSCSADRQNVIQNTSISYEEYLDKYNETKAEVEYLKYELRKCLDEHAYHEEQFQYGKEQMQSAEERMYSAEERMQYTKHQRYDIEQQLQRLTGMR